jgi:hypothetical protein
MVKKARDLEPKGKERKDSCTTRDNATPLPGHAAPLLACGVPGARPELFMSEKGLAL